MKNEKGKSKNGSPEGELFDTDNLIMYLEDRNKMSPREIIEGLLAGIKLFANGEP